MGKRGLDRIKGFNNKQLISNYNRNQQQCNKNQKQNKINQNALSQWGNTEITMYFISDEQKRLNKLNREKSPFNWLTAILISEEGYDLTTQFFWDLIRIEFGWTLRRLPSSCKCGIKLVFQHGLSCKKESFVSLRRNHIRKALLQYCQEKFVKMCLWNHSFNNFSN